MFEKLDRVTPDDIRKGMIGTGYKHINGHRICDIKMDGNFTRKAIFVADGHTREPPLSITYLSVVSRDSVRTVFLIASLNDLDIFLCNIGNTYFDAK